MTLPARPAVIILGAGASAPAGCPLIRDFIDRARDYHEQDRFDECQVDDVKAALELYGFLRREGFSITEEDIDNIENLLSLGELSKLIKDPPLEFLSNRALPEQLRRFIDAVITKSINVAPPVSAGWIDWELLGECSIYAWLVAALAHAENRIVVITLNYDCLVEYACHCMGLPYTYSRSFDEAGEGVEVLKLHGSTNWMYCPRPECQRHERPLISPLRHRRRTGDADTGYLERETDSCDLCSGRLTPLIVPPTWAKQMRHEVFREIWSRAAQALATAESLVAVGYSLPIGDVHVRQLIHVGLSSAKVREACVVLAADEESAQRWSSLFRESWRRNRLKIEQVRFQEAKLALRNTLRIPSRFRNNQLLLPIKDWMQNQSALYPRLRAALERYGENPDRVENRTWRAAASTVRTGGRLEPEKLKAIWKEAGMDWLPDTPNLPVHGNEFPIAETDVPKEES